MKKVIRLTESDLARIVKRIVNEQQAGNDIKLMEPILILNGFKKTIHDNNTFFKYAPATGFEVYLLYVPSIKECHVGTIVRGKHNRKTFKFPLNVKEVVNYAIQLKNSYINFKKEQEGRVLNARSTSR